jgi:signal transduction histidine kinase
MTSAAPVDVARWITSWQLWLVLLPFTLFSLATHLLDDFSLAQALLIAIVGSLAGGVLLWLASVTVFRHRRTDPPTLTQALVLWLVAGAVTYLAAEVMSRYAFGVADSPTYIIRDVSRYSIALVMRTVLALVGASALANTRLELAATQQALLSQRDELGQTEAYLAALQKRYTEFVKQSIEPRLHVLMSEVSMLKVMHSHAEVDPGIADELEEFGSHQVRALSHQIVDLVEVPEVEPSVSLPPALGPSGFALIHGWIRELPPALPWLVVFLVTRIGYGTYEPVTLWGGVGYAALCALGWLILTLARLIGERRTGELNRVSTWMGFGVLFSIGFVSWFVGLSFESLGDSLRSAQVMLIAQNLTSLLAVWILNYILVQRGRSKDSLEEVNAVLETSVSKRDLAAEQMRYRLAGILHGPVQGRLALASMTIRQFFETSDDHAKARARALNTVEEILDSIDRELAELATGVPSTKTFQEFITDMQQTWLGVLDIQARVGPSAAMTMTHLPEVQESVILVVKEAVMNARRHGRARFVFVSIEMYDRAQLQISVLDDGSGTNGQSGTGLGTRLFDRSTSSWSLSDVGFGGALFSALIDAPVDSTTARTFPGLVKVG